MQEEAEDSSDDDTSAFMPSDKWVPPAPDPRRVGCPFYYYFERKLRQVYAKFAKELDEGVYTAIHSILHVTRNTLSMWQLSDEKKQDVMQGEWR